MEASNQERERERKRKREREAFRRLFSVGF